MVRLGRRVAVGLGRRLAFLRDGGGCRRVSAQLVLCRVVSMAAIVRGSGAWLRAGVAGGGPSGLPLLGVCSQETSTPCTWSMVAVAGKGSTTMRRGAVRWQSCTATRGRCDIRNRCFRCS